jgi:hypothetical protein
MNKVAIEETVDSLDRWAREVLVGLKRDGDAAFVSDLVSSTTVDERQNVHYRVDEILEPVGFVEKHNLESEASPLPESRLELTDSGSDAAELVEEQWGADDIDETITSLKRGIGDLEARVTQLESAGTEGIERNVEEIKALVSKLEDGLQLKDFAIEDRRTIAEMRAGLSVIERVLIEDLDAGEHMVKRVSEERERIYTEMGLTDEL